MNWITGLLCEEHIPKPALLATLVLLLLFAAISVADFILFFQTGKHWPNYGVFATITGGGGGGGPYAMHLVNSYLNTPRGAWSTPTSRCTPTQSTGGGGVNAAGKPGGHPDNG